jgi:hypothetical protein
MEAIVFSDNDEVIAVLNPATMCGPMVKSGQIDRCEISFGGKAVVCCDLSHVKAAAEAHTGDITVHLNGDNDADFVRHGEGTSRVANIFAILQFVLHKYCGPHGPRIEELQ